MIVINTEYVKDKVKREKRNVRDKAKYKRNVNKAKNKGRKKEATNVDDYL
jgi:hypothetical protein